MVRDNKVLNADVALQLIEDQLEEDDNLDELFNRYRVEDIGVCTKALICRQILLVKHSRN